MPELDPDGAALHEEIMDILIEYLVNQRKIDRSNVDGTSIKTALACCVADFFVLSRSASDMNTLSEFLEDFTLNVRGNMKTREEMGLD